MTNNTLTLSIDDPTAVALIATIKAAVNGAGKYAKFVEEYPVTRDNVKDYARALAALAYPNDEPVQKKNGTRTRFGNAVQAAGNGLRAALPADETVKPSVLRVSLSGEGGGTAVVPADHPLYGALVELIGADQN